MGLYLIWRRNQRARVRIPSLTSQNRRKICRVRIQIVIKLRRLEKRVKKSWPLRLSPQLLRVHLKQTLPANKSLTSRVTARKNLVQLPFSTRSKKAAGKNPNLKRLFIPKTKRSSKALPKVLKTLEKEIRKLQPKKAPLNFNKSHLKSIQRNSILTMSHP